MQQTLTAIRRSTGLDLCIKIFDSRRRAASEAALIGQEDQLHLSEFCLSVKESQNDACIECDLRRIPALCGRERRPFFHVCHAGASELIIPVYLEGQLSAIAYIGQFRVSKRQPAQVEGLPLLSPSAQDHLLGLAPLIEAYLIQLLRTPRFAKETSQSYRREMIISFLTQSLSSNPDLPALASHLGLSVTRTAHVVRETGGQSFVELRDQLRLQRACDLLRTTYFKVSQIASECGFSSSHYFHRFFRKHTGLSPGEFRSQHRLEV